MLYIESYAGPRGYGTIHLSFLILYQSLFAPDHQFMAPPSSSSPSPTLNIQQALTAAITIKLDQDNYLLWKAQALPGLHSHDLYGFVDGTKEIPPKKVPMTEGSSTMMDNPEYAVWFRQDQQVLSSLLASLSPPVVGHMLFLQTAASVWQALDHMFASKSKAKIV